MTPRGIARLLTTLLILTLIFPKQAYAYLDPGTNSYLYQIAIASLLGGLLTIKLFSKKIITFLRKLISKDANKKETSR